MLASGSKTLLCMALSRKDIELVQPSPDHGADMHVRVSNRSSPMHDSTTFHFAAKWDDAEISQMLRSAGADVHAQVGRLGVTPLIPAVYFDVGWLRALAERPYLL